VEDFVLTPKTRLCLSHCHSSRANSICCFIPGTRVSFLCSRALCCRRMTSRARSTACALFIVPEV
jgi:hypothetical protein